MLDPAQDPMPFRRAVLGAALAAAAVALAAPAVEAQKSADPSMPLPPGVIRERGLEAAGAAARPGTQVFQVFRVGAPTEMVLSWYLRQLVPTEDAAPDTAGLQPGEATPISYHLTYHAFTDQCMNPGASASASSDATAPCKRWRRGTDKRRALNNSRVALPGGKWVDRFTLTWFSRGAQGELVRRQIDVRDAGLSDDWQRDELRSLITLERGVVEGASQ